MKTKTRNRAATGKKALTPAKDEAANHRAARPRRAQRKLEADARFLERVQAARESVRAGHGTRLEDA